jgi:hypothetical protein
MIPEAEIGRNYFPKIYEKDYTVRQLSEKKLFPDCQVLVSGNSTRCGKSKGAEYFLRIIQNLPLATGESGIAYIKSGMGQQQAGDSAKNLKETNQTNGHCKPMYDTLTYVITTTGSISKFQAGQFYMTQGRRSLV